ncbi:hypothetical protein [Salinisphaera orenii]|uniref:Uncharacterized protein n=1 Tax=Salinisphaera orenii YIM 95161 TaxID=1051139 RepID=A0A423PMQ0_9GAMM|nr:hypothetical protein [Salinisphaera halophila]ROO26781.1 hypothetical protein SAHL_12475 [Salinisphaera halophila YIM 95161]
MGIHRGTLLLALTALAALTACASGQVTRLTNDPISQPKVLSLDAPDAPWVVEIQQLLAKRGFTVKRWASTSDVTRAKRPGSVEQFHAASTRYVLVIEGSAPLNWSERCFGGGYKFDHISADLVDTRENQTLLNVNGSGYSEGCPPMSGSIFHDIASAVDDVWTKSGFAS